jgi:hypothetical protein
MNEKKSDQNVEDSLILPVITHYEYFIQSGVSARGVSVAVNEIFVHMDTHLSNRWICSLQCPRFHVYS